MYKHKNHIVEKRIILSAISADALRHLAETLKEAGWTNIEVSSLGLTAEYMQFGQHVIVITCLPCTPTTTELLITISSTLVPESELESLNVVGLLDALGNTDKLSESTK